jgi:hypothetical protein
MKKKIQKGDKFYIEVEVTDYNEVYPGEVSVSFCDMVGVTGMMIETRKLIPIPKKRKKKDPNADPLADYPILDKFYPKLCTYIERLHPRNAKLMNLKKSRKALAMLASKDGNKEQDVVDCLEWVFDSCGWDAKFWRKQVQSIVALRKPTKSYDQKFAAIFDKYHQTHSPVASSGAFAGDKNERGVF